MLDVVAAGPERAIRLDVFGRAAATFDGGRAWLDLTASAGIAARAVSAEDGELGVETWQGRFLVGPGGKLAPAPPTTRGSTVKAFQIPWKGTRAERDGGNYRETSPLQAAVLAGAALGDGTAYGVAEATLARVELATGNSSPPRATAWTPGSSASPSPRAPTCCWPASGTATRAPAATCCGPRAAGSRDRAGLHRRGSFVADDDGALGYTGSCVAAPRFDDPDESMRRFEGLDPTIPPVLCVRRAPPGSAAAAEWVERAVDLEPGAILAAWIPTATGRRRRW